MNLDLPQQYFTPQPRKMAPSTSSEKSFSEYGALESGDDAPTTVRDLVANGTLGADSFSVGEHQEDLTEVDEGKTRELFGSMHLSGHLALHHEFHVSFEADTSYTEESYEREEEFRAAAAARENCCSYAWRGCKWFEREIPWKSLLVNLICASGCVMFTYGLVEIDTHLILYSPPSVFNLTVELWFGLFLTMSVVLFVLSLPSTQREMTFSMYDQRYHPRRYLHNYWTGALVRRLANGQEAMATSMLKAYTSVFYEIFNLSFYICGLLVFANFWVSFALIIVSVMLVVIFYLFLQICAYADDVDTFINEIPEVFFHALPQEMQDMIDTFDYDVVYSCNHSDLYLKCALFMTLGSLLTFAAHIPQIAALADVHRAYGDTHALIKVARRLELYRGLVKQKGLTLMDKHIDADEAKLRDGFEAGTPLRKCCGGMIVVGALVGLILALTLPHVAINHVVVVTGNVTMAPTPLPTGPSYHPTYAPTYHPTHYPTYHPSARPSPLPTTAPSRLPLPLPTPHPTFDPTVSWVPSASPSPLPTAS